MVRVEGKETKQNSRTLPSRNFRLLVPATNTEYYSRVGYALEYATEESNHVDMLHGVDPRRCERQEAPDHFERRNKDVRTAEPSGFTHCEWNEIIGTYRTLVSNMLLGIIAKQYPAWKTPVVY